MDEHAAVFPSDSLWETWELPLNTTTDILFTTQDWSDGGGQCRAGRALLLLSSPDDDHATGIAGGQQTLIAVEADV